MSVVEPEPMPVYSYVKRRYGVAPRVGQNITHHVTGMIGVIKEPEGDPQYLLVEFYDGRGPVNVHPTECDYIQSAGDLPIALSADAILRLDKIASEMDGDLRRRRMICSDCGLPVAICNARAMYDAAVKEHGAGVVFDALFGELVAQKHPDYAIADLIAELHSDGRA